MSEPKAVELTEAEMDDLYDTWMFNYEWANLVAAIARIVAARETAARREAWDECAEGAQVCECALGAHVEHGANPYRATEETP